MYCLINQLNENIVINKDQINSLMPYFYKKTSSWKILKLDIEEDNAIAIMQYKTAEKALKHVYYHRDLNNQKFFLDWKIIYLV
jgi:uncharacterized protein YccT (UPF0319 family)